jgi:hypothetical protein
MFFKEGAISNVVFHHNTRSPDSSVDIVMGYRLDSQGYIPGRDMRLFSLHSIQISSGAHPDFYQIDTRGSFLRGKWPGHEADHSPPSSAEVKNGRNISPLYHTSNFLNLLSFIN